MTISSMKSTQWLLGLILFLPILLLPISALAQPMGTQATWGPYTVQYAGPVGTYPHGVFGDPVEPSTILDLGAEAYFTAPLAPLSPGHVFEDRLPRFVDMEGDGEPELLTIVTDPAQGAGAWLWGRDGQVRARSAFHGQGFRWLNPLLGSLDIDGDGDQELLIIRTPHIDPTLNILDENSGQLDLWAPAARGFVSNHRFGDPELATSYICQGQASRTLLIMRETAASAPFVIEISSRGARPVDAVPRYEPADLDGDSFDFLTLWEECQNQ